MTALLAVALALLALWLVAPLVDALADWLARHVPVGGKRR